MDIIQQNKNNYRNELLKHALERLVTSTNMLGVLYPDTCAENMILSEEIKKELKQ